MKVGILGSGSVGQTLGSGFLAKGHQVVIGTREPAKLAAWAGKNPGATVGSFADAAAFGDIVVLATKGTAALQSLKLAGTAALAGKIVMDATNPIADVPPTDGVLKFFTTHDQSLMEQLQAEVPAARFVKAYSCVGAPNMVDPKFAGGRPTMFICGNDATAKATVAGILDAFGWDAEDMGPAIAARAIEPLCILWCIPGFAKNDWVHAFKMLR